MRLAVLPLLLATFVSAQRIREDSELDKWIGERLDFIDRNMHSILRQGHFPALFDSSFPKIKQCGCYYSPSKINYGTGIGLSCPMRWPEENPPYDEERCGVVCSDPHGTRVVLFCPHGWDQSCERGCYPPDSFSSPEARMNFWELTLTTLIMYGHDYIPVAQEYLEDCGCTGKIKPIRYGSKIGFECTMPTGEARANNACHSSYQCKNSEGKRVVTFCPSGHRATCNGCEKDIEGRDYRSRLNWMVDVITGYARESQELLGWAPTTQQILDCNCSQMVQPIRYGLAIGYFCPVRDVRGIKNGCGPNILCKNEHNEEILTFCPGGFLPSCDLGCTVPWGFKKEL